MADINNLDDEQRINDVLSERKNIIDNNNESLEKTSGLTSDVLNIENDINNALLDEKEKRENINNEVEKEIINESKVIDIINNINNALETENTSREIINLTIDEQKQKIDEVKTASENMLSSITSAITEQIKYTQTLTKKLGKVVNAYNHISNAAQNAANSSGNINAPQQPNNGNTQTQNNSQQSSNIEDVLDKFMDKKGEFSKKDAATYAYEGIKNITKYSFYKWVEIDDKVHKVGRTIGMTGAQARAMVEDITNNYGDMAQRLGMSWNEIFKFQENYNKSIGRGTILANEQVEAMAGLSKLVGDTAIEDVVKNMDNLGASTDTATLYLTQNMARAKAHGLDAKKTSEAFANNIKLASKYNFREGVNGISKMTLLSQKLKFNMDSIANAAEKFETVEGAIGTAANLQMLGGSFAAQFGNPLEAMNLAMLDMEGFTNKIVDTFSGKAIFNRETGQAEMSAIDKRFLKEAAKQLGINYEDAWNMATQSAKIKDVERSLKPTEGFTEEDKALIANKSIFKDGKHHITFYGEDNEKITKSVDQLTKDDLKFLTDEKTTEIAMADDVHGIKLLLQDYLQKTVKETKSTKEIYEGNKEQFEMFGANVIDGIFGEEWFKSLHDGMQGWGQAILLGGVSLLGNYLNSIALNKINKALTKSVNTPNGGAPSGGAPSGGAPSGGAPSGGAPSGGAPSGKKGVFKHGLKRAPKRAILKAFGKNGLKTLGKRLPYVGTAIAAIGGIVEGANAISTYNKKQAEIENSDLSAKEKAIAKTEAKREKNKGIGGAIGGTAGTLGGAAAGAKVGAAIGTFFGPGIGTAIGGLLGGAIGGAAGYFMGKGVGGTVGEAVTIEEKVNDENKQNKVNDNNEILSNDKLLSQIRDYNQLIYELLLNRYSMISESTINNNSSFNQNVIENASKQLGVNNNYAYQNFDYKKLSNGYISNDVVIKGNPIRTYNDKEYDLRDPRQRRDYNIDKILNREINGTREYELRDSKLNLENRAAKILYGIEPYDYKKDERYIGNDKTPKNKKVYITDYGDFDVNQNLNYQNSLVSNPNTYYNSSNMLFDNVKYGKTKTILNPNTYYNSSNMLFDNILVKDSYYNSNSSITPKVTVGLPTSIKDTSIRNYYETSLSNVSSNKIDLNVSGTIKLTSDRGNKVDLDLNELIRNEEFIKGLVAAINSRVSKDFHGGRVNKNDDYNIIHGTL